jgi:hypothetical protein
MDSQAVASQPVRAAANALRATAAAWAAAAMLPLPILATTDPAGSGFVSCLYLAFASGWLVVEFHRTGGGPPDSAASWRARTLAVVTAVAVNVALFVAFGVAAGVRTNFPFPLMAALSAIPAVGIVPWLLRRVRQPYASLVLAAVLVLAAKLAACVVARIVYGPDYLEQGYASADWRSAKLMISLFWVLGASMSLGLLLAESTRCKRTRRTGSADAGPGAIGSPTAAGGAA